MNNSAPSAVSTPRPVRNRGAVLIVFAPLLLLAGFALLPRLTGQTGQTGQDTSYSLLSPASSDEHHSNVPKQRFIAATPAQQKKLEAVVAGQIGSMRKGDYKAAMKFAAPDFRSHWTPVQFQQMIESGYKAVPQSRTTHFARGRIMGPNAMLRTTVYNLDGVPTGFVYQLTRIGDKWCVNSCSHTTGSDEVEI